MKRFLALVLLCCCTGCTASNETYYQQAQRLLGAGEYDTAAELFDQLGGYADSTEYALYAAGLYALSQGDAELCRRSLEQVDPFLNSSRYLAYLDARELASSDELEDAAALYQSLGAFCDSAQQALTLLAEIPARDIRRARALIASGGYQQAQSLLSPYAGGEEADALLTQCAQGLLRQAYDRAVALYDEGLYSDALSAFESLGDTMDAAARSLACRSALYAQAETDFAQVTLSSCEALMERYAALDGYLNSADRIRQLQDRFAVNLLLRDRAGDMPYVRYGIYATQESGAPQPLLWRVLRVEEDEVTLLCGSVIDAVPVASVTDLDVGIEDTLALPEEGMLAPLEDLRCTATPYAIAQGVEHHSDGCAWWWLADEAAPGRNAIVWYNGAVLPQGVDADAATVGVRPVLHLDLNEHTFTQGSGTKADPFR